MVAKDINPSQFWQIDNFFLTKFVYIMQYLDAKVCMPTMPEKVKVMVAVVEALVII